MKGRGEKDKFATDTNVEGGGWEEKYKFHSIRFVLTRFLVQWERNGKETNTLATN